MPWRLRLLTLLLGSRVTDDERELHVDHRLAVCDQYPLDGELQKRAKPLDDLVVVLLADPRPGELARAAAGDEDVAEDEGAVLGAWHNQVLVALIKLETHGLRPVRVINL